MRFSRTAFFSVCVMLCWPTTDLNVAGRYLRAETIYSILFVIKD